MDKQRRPAFISFLLLLLTAGAGAQTTFQSGTNINLPASQTIPAPANPYPSTIYVSGMVGVIGKVTVTLCGVTHDFPEAMNILLVSPQGQSVVLLSDVGGAVDVSNLTITLDDDATASLPDGAPLTSGTFKPTNFDSTDSWPAPAPATSTNTALSSLYGQDPNGEWKLYAVNNVTGVPGYLSCGWSLSITAFYVLPGRLTSFSAEAGPGGEVNLHWTADGSVASSFLIERSYDGAGWQTIGRTHASPNSHSTARYRYTDGEATGSKLFYRLQLVDRNGHARYSPTVQASRSDPPVEVSFYPNPATSVVQVKSPAPIEWVQVVDMSGKVLLSENRKVAPGSPYSLDIQSLKPGTYFLRLKSSKREQVKKILVTG